EAKLAYKRQLAEDERAEKERKAEQARKDAEAKRRQEQAEARRRQEEKARAKAARMAKLGKVARWLNANPVTVFVGFVMVCSVVPAVISQVVSLAEAGVFVLLAALLAAMLEGTAWALTFMGKAAEDAGRPAAKYRIGTWVTAFLAAAVQYWHWSLALPEHAWVAWVFAGSSLVAIYLWDMKTHGSHGKTRQERAEEKRKRRHLAQRRKDHKEVAAEAARLLSAAPYGSLDEEDAFAAAWQIHYGTQPGMTPALYAKATDARVALGAAFQLADGVRPELVRAGMLAAVYNPLADGLGGPLSALTRTGPVQALPKASEGPTAQAGIGLSAIEKAGAKPGENGGGNASNSASGNTSRGRSEAELEQLLPDAHQAAEELVAEGKQISAAQLASRLQIRREDAVFLRDRVIAERKLRLVG
ncbi:hypothetical protein ACH41A_35030, partial [Streptomyces wuyuanensis]